MSEELPYAEIVAECFQAMKGGFSLEQTARKLNVSRSTIYSWINQKSSPSWDHFYTFMVATKRIAINTVYWRDFNVFNGSNVIQSYVEKHGLEEVLRASGLSRSGLKKILKEGHSPKVESVFKIWDYFARHQFLVFLYSVVGLRESNWFGSIALKWTIEIELSERFPFFAGALIYIGTCNEDDADLSKKLSSIFEVDQTEINDLLKELEIHGFVERIKGRLKYTTSHYFNSTINFSIAQKLSIYWGSLALHKFSQHRGPKENHAFSYALLKLTKEQAFNLKKESDKLMALGFSMSQEQTVEEKDLISLSLQMYRLSD